MPDNSPARSLSAIPIFSIHCPTHDPRSGVRDGDASGFPAGPLQAAARHGPHPGFFLELVIPPGGRDFWVLRNLPPHPPPRRVAGGCVGGGSPRPWVDGFEPDHPPRNLTRSLPEHMSRSSRTAKGPSPTPQVCPLPQPYTIRTVCQPSPDPKYPNLHPTPHHHDQSAHPWLITLPAPPF